MLLFYLGKTNHNSMGSYNQLSQKRNYKKQPFHHRLPVL
jgi:hypothetical protein